LKLSRNKIIVQNGYADDYTDNFAIFGTVFNYAHGNNWKNKKKGPNNVPTRNVYKINGM